MFESICSWSCSSGIFLGTCLISFPCFENFRFLNSKLESSLSLLKAIRRVASMALIWGPVSERDRTPLCKMMNVVLYACWLSRRTLLKA